MIKKIFSFSIMIIFAGFLITSIQAQSIELGKIIKRIICINDSQQSYALYLPADYSAGKKWPIIYAFDPGARATLPLQLFKKAAEKYGYILVCSYNCRNGPREPVIEAMKAIWLDTNQRFSINKKRVYATGFSGGARGASFFKYIIRNPVAGIIACGAGLSTGLNPERYKLARSYFYGIVGVADFNYQEMRELKSKLTVLAVPNRLVIFDGQHSWPSEMLCTQAVDWLELHAMKNKLEKKDAELMEKIFKSEMTQAMLFETKGQLFFAVNAYQDIIESFREWRDLEALEEKLKQLKKHQDFIKFQKDEYKRKRKEIDSLREFSQVFFNIKTTGMQISDLRLIFRNLNIKNLEKETKKENIFDKGLAIRLIYNLGNKARLEGEHYYQKKDFRRAIIFWEIAARGTRNTLWYPYNLYSLACGYALKNKKKAALKNLKLAVENGFSDASHIEKDEDLKSIKQEPEFQEILNFSKTKNQQKNH